MADQMDRPMDTMARADKRRASALLTIQMYRFRQFCCRFVRPVGVALTFHSYSECRFLLSHSCPALVHTVQLLPLSLKHHYTNYQQPTIFLSLSFSVKVSLQHHTALLFLTFLFCTHYGYHFLHFCGAFSFTTQQMLLYLETSVRLFCLNIDFGTLIPKK